MDLCDLPRTDEIQKKMVAKDKYKRHLFVTTFLLLIFVFIGGILLGRAISNLEEDEITEFIKENELNTESYLIEQELIKTFDENKHRINWNSR